MGARALGRGGVSGGEGAAERGAEPVGRGRRGVLKQPRSARTPRHGSEAHRFCVVHRHSPPRPAVYRAGGSRADCCRPGDCARMRGGRGRAATGAHHRLRQHSRGVPQPAQLGAGAQLAGAAPVRFARAAGAPRAGARMGRWVGGQVGRCASRRASRGTRWILCVFPEPSRSFTVNRGPLSIACSREVRKGGVSCIPFWAS